MPCYHFSSPTSHNASLYESYNSFAIKGEPIVPNNLTHIINLCRSLLSTPLRSHLPFSSAYPSQPLGILCKTFKNVLFSSLRLLSQIWENGNTVLVLCQDFKNNVPIFSTFFLCVFCTNDLTY